jgi:hypothetical protein
VRTASKAVLPPPNTATFFPLQLNTGSYFGRTGAEVDIRDKRHPEASGPQPFFNPGQVMCFGNPLGGKADHFTTGIDQTNTLGEGSLNVVGVGIGHGLHPDGEMAAQGQIACFYNT